MSELYLRLAELPTYTSARFIAPTQLSVTSSISNHDKKKKQSFSKSISLSPELKLSQYDDADSVKAIAVSPSMHRQAILRQVEENDSPERKRRFIEIWKGDKLEARKDVTDDHGEFYADESYRSLSFSPSENAFVYTAEATAPGPTVSDPYAPFRYTPPLGEGFPGKSQPTLYIFRWTHDSDPSTSLTAVSFKQTFTPPVIFGQATFISEGNLIATGHAQTLEGRLLGLKYCQNRPTGIYLLENAKTSGEYDAVKLTPPEISCRSARLSPDGKHLYFIANDVFGPHASCASLLEFSLESKNIRTVVDRVFTPCGEDDFPGLYIDQLPPQPFLNFPDDGGLHIITQSIWRSEIAVLLISINGGKVTNLTAKDRSNWTVLTTDGSHRVVCSKCSINEPFELLLGTVRTASTIGWLTMDTPALPQDIKEKLASLDVSVHRIPGRSPTEAIVVRKAVNDEPHNDIMPCISSVHGGPHSTWTRSFNPATVAQALEGYTICIPNYTGSLGFGQDSVQKLIGRCGTLDIDDCMESIRYLIKIGIAEEGPGKQFVVGGSHGGFIAGHLIGQYPDFFSAAVIRNPVMSAAEPAATDIFDWYYSEFGYPYEPTIQLTPHMFSELRAASPIHYIDSVKTPVLLCIGGEDRRVAPTQGINYYHALKGRSKEVEMLTFKKESHPLDGVEAARVNYEAGMDWINRARVGAKRACE